ncbi:MAG: F0F1 ATP synthase subunit B [Verrucomicrobia bacterium]|nr:F0F1 ATP synthase subunit B [Verrucomicrobiota bacterium]MBV9130243.1 F0F1 ATP synthase subunit B [Verrucomicrobiota bacterium]MBV9642303.1 F0F1 ATP synthase subunit B [Verrucomicrobiota bacterium]
MDAVGNVAQQFGVYWPNLIAQVVLFAIVYLVLKRYAFKPVIAMLEERRRRIEEGQLNAENIKKQLAAAEAKYQEILSKANTEAQRLLDEVRASGDRLAEQKQQEAVAAAEQISLKAKEAMTLERDRLMEEMKRELGRLVVDTTTRVTGKVLTPEDHQRINEETAREVAA